MIHHRHMTVHTEPPQSHPACSLSIMTQSIRMPKTLHPPISPSFLLRPLAQPDASSQWHPTASAQAFAFPITGTTAATLCHCVLQDLITRLEQEAFLEQCGPQDLSNIAWALSKLGGLSEELLDLMATRALQDPGLVEFNAQEVCGCPPLPWPWALLDCGCWAPATLWGWEKGLCGGGAGGGGGRLSPLDQGKGLP